MKEQLNNDIFKMINKFMKTFKSFLNEGLVKVDKNTLDILTAIAMRASFQFGLDHVDMPPEKAMQLKKKIEEYDTYLSTQEEYIREVNEWRYNIEVYSDDYDIETGIAYLLDPNGKTMGETTGAAFSPDTNAIYVNLMSNMYKQLMGAWLSGNDNILDTVINAKRSEIRHELTHLLQYHINQKTGARQLRSKKFYSDAPTDDEAGRRKHMSDYFTSEVEREAQTVNLVNHVETVLRLYKDIFGESVTRKQADAFVAALGGNVTKEGVILPQYLKDQSNDLFIKLKREIAPKKFRMVFNKFYQEVQKSLEELEKTGYIEA